MAVNNLPTSVVLRMRLQTGVDDDGDPIYSNKNLSNVKVDAQDQDIYDVAIALTQLHEHELVSVMRIDTAKLEEAV